MVLCRTANIWYNIKKRKSGGHIMAADNEITRELGEVQGGRITFAPDVIATIASLAAAEVEGVEGMAGGVVEGITGMLYNKKSITKGVRVDVNEDLVTIELNVIIKYGFKLHEVCANIQNSIKNAIETMTGLTVAAVNVSVQSISFEKAKKQPQQPAVEPAAAEEEK